MNKQVTFLSILMILLQSTALLAVIRSVKVSDQDAVLLFRDVGGAGVPLREDTKNEILHTDLMMCSIYLNIGQAPKFAGCLLPNEQVKVENENALEVTTILKSYNMPSNHQLGYETVQAGLDCTHTLSGDRYHECYLTPKE